MDQVLKNSVKISIDIQI